MVLVGVSHQLIYFFDLLDDEIDLKFSCDPVCLSANFEMNDVRCDEREDECRRKDVLHSACVALLLMK